MNKYELFKVLLQISFLNLRSHAGKTLIVGSIMFFGTALWTIGSSMVGSVEKAMSETMVESVTGNFQIYEEGTRDKLAMFGGGSMGAPDIGEIPRFSALTEAVKNVPNIKAIVPMGTTVALLANPSQLDDALADLRTAVRAGDKEAMKTAASRTRYLMEYLVRETETRSKGQNLTAEIEQNLKDLRYAVAATFWTDYELNPLEKLEFLDTRIAPLGSEGTLLYMRVLGTDLDHYRKVFGQFELVEGEMVPPGERGFMMPQQFRERVKNKVARELDEMKVSIRDGGTFADDEALRDKVKRNVRQYKRILFDLDPAQRDPLTVELRKELGKPDASIDELMQEFLNVNDENFARRYQFFYDVIAPKADLYPVDVGESVTMRAFTRSGYMRSSNLKMYGIFRFKGMEDSDLAGVYNLVDMMTFREMYGTASAEQKAELAAISASVGVADVSREDAEASLFGGDGPIVEEKAVPPAKPRAELAPDSAPVTVVTSRTFSQADIDNGLALHAAVLLQDDGKAKETKQQLQDAIKTANLKLRVVDWQDAAGFAGQMTLAMRAVLIFGMFIIFLVALVVVNNTVIISTMERINEIGTLRAIGAQRSFILIMFLLETMAIAALAGITGAATGAGIVSALGVYGIPAFTKNINFLFGGPRLYPSVGAADMIGGLFIILIVSMAATYFPARAATRVQPVEAMRDGE